MNKKAQNEKWLKDMELAGVDKAVIGAVREWLATVPSINQPDLEMGLDGGILARWADGSAALDIETDGTAQGTYFEDADVLPATIKGKWADLRDIVGWLSDQVAPPWP